MTPKLLSAIGAAFLLTACATNNVVEHPLKLNDLDPELMQTPAPSRCGAPPTHPKASADNKIDARDLDQFSRALEKYSNCWRKAYEARDVLVKGIQSAVRVRQEAAAKAVAAAKL